MAKKIREMVAGELPVSSDSVTETEREELATASVAAEATTEDGEASDRLPYPPRTFLALGKSIPSFLWVAFARWLKHPADEAEVRTVIAYDGPEVTCTAPSGQCTYKFCPVRMAHINLGNPKFEDGSLQTDERVVSETNPRGIAYRGAYLAVPVDPKNQHSKLRVLGPLCQRDQRSLSASYKDAGWFVKSFGQIEVEAFVASFNAAKDASRQAYMDRKDANARAAGLVTEDGKRVERGGGNRGGFNNPHRAAAGRRSRGDRTIDGIMKGRK